MSDRMFPETGQNTSRAPSRPQPVAQMETLGEVVSVSGSNASILLSPGAAPQIGDLTRIETSAGVCYAILSAVRSDAASASNATALRFAEMELLGEAYRTRDGGLGAFRRGLSAYPTLGAKAHCASRDDLARAYRLNDSAASIAVGALHQDPSLPATIRIDEMMGKHFAILGATGTGKSCTVALLLQTILQSYANAHTLLLDAHGEYAAAFDGMAEVITHRDLRIPFWILTHDEIGEVLLGDGEDYRAELELLGDLIRLAKATYAADPTGAEPEPSQRLKRRSGDIAGFSSDTPAPYRMADILRLIDDRMGSLEHQDTIFTHRRLRGRIDARMRDQRYEFMFGPDAAAIDLTEVLSRLFRFPVAGRPLAILELSGLPSEVLSVIVSLVARIAFDFAIRSDGQAPITLICEEAHKYVPADGGHGFLPARRSIARIAKEGRKYGVCLGIVTQRPSEIDPTIVSQCNTVFSLRLSNEADQRLVRSAVSDAAGGLMRFLPALATGEAIAFGDGVSLPMRLVFKRLPENRLPGGATPLFSEGWAEDATNKAYVQEIVARWRGNEAADRRSLNRGQEARRELAPPPSPNNAPAPSREPTPRLKTTPPSPRKRERRGWGRPDPSGQ